MKKRLSQINELIREEVSRQILSEVSDPAAGMITVTAVDTSPDLKHASVWVSFLSPDHARSLQVLEGVRGQIQHAINRRLTMKFVPRISFKEDHSAERVGEINKILGRLKED